MTMNHPALRFSLGLSMLLALLTALDAMAIDMYLPGMPSIMTEFGVSASQVQLTFSVFLAGLALGQGLYGPLLDRYGRRFPLLLGVLLFIMGSALAALAPSMEWLLVARFLQALGAAAGLVTPRAIVTDLCSLSESAKIFSLLMQIMMIAPIIAPLLGGYLLEYSDWRMIFWVMAALGCIGLFWSVHSIPESLPMTKRRTLRFIDVMKTYRQQFKQHSFMRYVVASGFLLGSLFVYISASSFVFTHAFGLTTMQYSYLFAANSIALVLGGVVSNFLLNKQVDAKKIMLLGVITHCFAGVLLWGLILVDLMTFYSYVGLLALAIGALGLVFGNLTALAMEHGGENNGVASAVLGMLQYLISAVVGYLVSLVAQGPAAIPLAISVCGGLACWLCLRPQPPHPVVSSHAAL